MSTIKSLILLVMIVFLTVSGCNSDGGSSSTDGDSDQSAVDGDDPVSDGDADADPVDGDASDGDIEQEANDPCTPNPCDEANKTVCADDGEGNAVCSCDDGFCDIDGECVADGTENPDHVCSVCDSATEKNGWSLRGTNHECRASAGECDVAEVCDGVNEDCPADGLATNGTACDTTNQCVAGVCEDCFDTNGCTDFTEDSHDCTDLACEANTCTNSIGDNACLINNTCHAQQEDDPNNECQWCLTTQSQTAWTYKANGVACSDDGLSCTDDICSGAGTCIHNANDEGCLISGSCYDNMAIDPANECQWCVISQLNTGWTGKANGAACSDDGNPCTDDICNGASPSTCIHPNDDSNTCSDDDDCTDNDMCTGGSCSGQTYTCNDNGTCNSDDNVCTCETGYAGDYCDACADGYTGYPDCQRDTTPGFVFITAGSFWMGSPDGTCPTGYPGSCTSELGRYSNEVLHEVTLTYDFEMMTTEVTQGQWRAVAQAEGWDEDPSYFSSCGDDCPVERVNWYEALEYANSLSRNAGLSECYTLTNCTGTIGSGCGGSTGCFGYECTVALNGVTKPQDCEGYRLPTEAEWEYAIRAGNQYTAFYQSTGNTGIITQTGRSPLDPNLDQIGWYGGNSGVSYSGGYGCSSWYTGVSTCGTYPVASKAANAWGLYDMIGNLWEWTWDWYQSGYQNDVATDPTGPATGPPSRVLRGGSWDGYAQLCRSAYRYSVTPDSRYLSYGFRLCRSRP